MKVPYKVVPYKKRVYTKFNVATTSAEVLFHNQNDMTKVRERTEAWPTRRIINKTFYRHHVELY